MANFLQSFSEFGLAGSLGLFQANGGIPWWVWIVLIILLLVILYFVLRGSQKKAEVSAAEPPPAPASMPVVPDDFTVIEGVGPKINEFLHNAGYQTYQQLAAADMQTIDNMLDEAKLRLADPTTWGEQARLAAAGEWQALKEMQDQLKGGRVE